MAPIITEVVGALVAAGSIAGGLVLGRWLIHREPTRTGPICSCTHGYGTHDEKGRCNDQIRRRQIDGTYWADCRCLRYDGPMPVGEVWVPPMSKE